MKRLYLIALFSTLALTVVFQAVTNSRLYNKLRDAQREGRALNVAFPPLKGTTPLGVPVVHDFTRSDSPTLVLGFYPACPFCQENWPNWKAIAAKAAAKGIRVY